MLELNKYDYLVLVAVNQDMVDCLLPGAWLNTVIEDLVEHGYMFNGVLHGLRLTDRGREALND